MRVHKVRRLPTIPGFSVRNGSPSDSDINAHSVDKIADAFKSVLTQPRFDKGSQVRRVCVNLAVLFRLIVFYGDLADTDKFWRCVASDWGLRFQDRDAPSKVRRLVHYYTMARKRSIEIRKDPCRATLLMRLVDFWIKQQIFSTLDSNNIDSIWKERRAAWAKLRDGHVQILLSPRELPCLVERASKLVTLVMRPAHRPEDIDETPDASDSDSDAGKEHAWDDDLSPEELQALYRLLDEEGWLVWRVGIGRFWD
ncbi:hypothetical protein HIM_00791 [Hirsutella minnesotensis 3608]|nr:hypothetical protein HIM_00791 [Hirsutella minnesotensis 3608]